MQLDVNGYYALTAPLFLLLVGSEVAIKRWRGEPLYRFANTVNNVSTGLGLIVVGLFLGPVLFALYEFVFERFAIFRFDPGSWVVWPVAFVLGDLCYYWHHRAGHRVALLWSIHGVHHQSEDFDVGIALRTPWLADTYSAIFYAPAPLLGIPPGPFFLSITILTIYSYTIHSRAYDRPGLGILVTPQTHIAHHATNPRYLDRNFGAVFNVWDRLFGTYVEVDALDPPRLGMPEGYETHDGALSNWVIFSRLLERARGATTLRDRLRTFLGPPGWRASGVVEPPSRRPREEAAIPTATRVYVALGLAQVMVFAAYVLWLRERHAPWLSVSGSALILVSLATLGGLLDGRRGAVAHESVRLAATIALGVLAVGLGLVTLGGALVACAVVAAVALAVLGEGGPGRALASQAPVDLPGAALAAVTEVRAAVDHPLEAG